MFEVVNEQVLVTNIVEWILSHLPQIGMFFVGTSVVLWMMSIWWVWMDAKDRYNNIFMIMFMVLLGGVPFIGLMIYLSLRGKYRLDEDFYMTIEKKILLAEYEDILECPVCNKIVKSGFNVCPGCGSILKKKCPECNEYIRIDYKYCFNCGKLLIEEKKEKKTANKIEVVGERMTKGLEKVTKKLKNYLKTGVSKARKLIKKA